MDTPTLRESTAATGFVAVLDELRRTEYDYLDQQRQVYLDWAGAGLASRAQHQAHADRLARSLYGNPHSESPASRASTDFVEAARARVLEHLNADPAEYDAIFTANATAAARLVGEAFPFSRAQGLVLTADNHNSMLGLREFARRRRARTTTIPVRAPELRVDTSDVMDGLARGDGGLFAWPAQSNFSGVRHPLAWVELAQSAGYQVLLDAAAYLPTSHLDLSEHRPEFIIASWYKVFGYPTGVGCLIARRDALEGLSRPWFSGGTVQAASAGIPWHRLAPGAAAFEDGTVNYLAIPDVHFGLDWIDGIGLDVIGARVRSLTGRLLNRLTSLRHSDGSPLVRIYGPTGTEGRGGTVALNVLDRAGHVVDERLVAADATARRISARYGCFCNPGVGEAAFGLTPRRLRALRRANTVDEGLAAVGLPSGGAIRVSFGLASTLGDVEQFAALVEQYRDRAPSTDGLPPRTHC